MGKFAENTTVSSSASRDEIERTLRRYGATQFAYGWSERQALLGFVARDRQVKFVLPLPDVNDEVFRLTPSKKWERTPQAQAEEYEKAVRQRWRALALVIKAKLEAVEAGIVEFDQEFLAHLVLPEGDTVAERVLPPLRTALAEGRTPPALLSGMGD